MGLQASWAWSVLGIGAAWASMRYFEWKNIYYPVRELTRSPADLGLEFEDITFISEDARLLHGWWIPCRNARGTIVHCQGNAGNISDRIELAADLKRLGVNVLLFDYRGYGRSRGFPTERGTYADARAAFEVARARHGDQDAPPIVVHGCSLGGAVAIQLALDKPVRGLIVESTFTSVRDMARYLYPALPLYRMVHFRYDSGAKIGRVLQPKLIAHSRVDELVPFEMGQKLFALAEEPKEFVTLSGGHNDAGWHTTPEYWDAIARFLHRVL